MDRNGFSIGTHILSYKPGVAMANGSDATRFAADFVTASNDKDGIAIFIEEHLL